MGTLVAQVYNPMTAGPDNEHYRQLLPTTPFSTRGGDSLRCALGGRKAGPAKKSRIQTNFHAHSRAPIRPNPILDTESAQQDDIGMTRAVRKASAKPFSEVLGRFSCF